MLRRSFFRVTAASFLAPLLPLGVGCETDEVRFGPFEADVRASADGLVFFDGAGRSYLVAPDATSILSADAAGQSLGQVAANVTLNAPKGVCATHDGTRFLVDRGAGRVLRLGEDGQVDLEFGGGELAMPGDLDAGSDGTLFVADTLNHQIRVFDAEGRLLASFGTPGTGDGELNAPLGVSCSRGLVYVANGGNGNVLAFDHAGRNVASFEKPEGRFRPTGIACRGTEEVLVIDTNACALYVYDASGSLVERRDVRDASGRRAHPIALSVDPRTGSVSVGALPGPPV